MPPGAPLLWQVPPEAVWIRPSPQQPGANGTTIRGPAAGGPVVDLGPGQVTDVIDLGRAVEVVVSLASGIELRSRALGVPDLSVGAACRVESDASAISVWAEPAVTGARTDTARVV
jgi:hypothetical protein